MEQLAKKIIEGDRRALAKAITLVSSQLESDKKQSDELLSLMVPQNKSSLRVGITGIPGVGKSSFIEAFGHFILSSDLNIKISVLAVDPSSPKSGGSVLGDKIRMNKLANHPRAFIRPIPSCGEKGGLVHQTHEIIQLMESSAFDLIFIETVGVGQADDHLANYCDLLIHLQMPSTGDDIQGLKKGAIELADMIVINKNDSHLKEHAQITAEYFRSAFKMKLNCHEEHIKIFLTSVKENTGFENLWNCVNKSFFIPAKNNDSFFYKTRQSKLKKILDKKLEVSFLDLLSQNSYIVSLKEEQVKNLQTNKTTLRKSSKLIFDRIFIQEDL